MGQRVTTHNEPRVATGSVIPELHMWTARIVPQINVVEHCGFGSIEPIGPLPTCIAPIGKFLNITRSAVGTRNAHVKRFPSLQVRMRAHPPFVNQTTRGEAVESVRSRDRMGLVVSDQMGKAEA